ncbi:hypothetical protein LB505_006579 [Fusarium chuoi]|nr:hypothetical protein LB505_006579 [Fusarium chuoi]
MTFEQFVRAYNHGEVEEPELDEYFMHDRAVRESGHDTSYRLEVFSMTGLRCLRSFALVHLTSLVRSCRQLLGTDEPSGASSQWTS